MLISHAHRDHLDLPTLKALPGAPRIVVPTGLAGVLREAGINRVEEVAAGDHVGVGQVSVTAFPALHDGNRPPLGPRAVALGFVIAGSSRTYFAGDTDIFPEMERLRGETRPRAAPGLGMGAASRPRPHEPRARGRGGSHDRRAGHHSDPLGRALPAKGSTRSGRTGSSSRPASSRATRTGSAPRPTCASWNPGALPASTVRPDPTACVNGRRPRQVPGRGDCSSSSSMASRPRPSGWRSRRGPMPTVAALLDAQPSDRGMAGRNPRPDLVEPGGHPLRRRLRHPCLSLVREGARQAHRVESPG